MPEEQKAKKGPFSPLQTGCAFVMLTNMLLYLCVIAFVFNLLDPSKLDPNYLAKRGFTTPKNESPEDRAFRKMAEKMKEEQRQIQEESMDLSVESHNIKPSPAEQLSKLNTRARTTNWKQKQSLPLATLTQNFTGGTRETSAIAKSRQSITPTFPRAVFRNSYPSYTLPSARPIAAERYDAIAVELVPGITFPLFTIPVPGPNNNLTYTPSDAPPHGLKINAPSEATEAHQTNELENVQTGESTAPLKDTL